MRTFLLTILSFLALALPAQVTVEARLDANEMLIGEQVELTAVVNAAAGTRVKFPQYADGYLTKGVEVLEQSRVDTALVQDGKRVTLTKRYTLTAFDSALYSLPPVEVEAGGRKYRSAGNIGLKVGTVPVDTLHADSFPGPHGAVEGAFQWDGRLFRLSLCLWALLGGAFVLLVRFSNGRPITRRVVIKPPVPPHECAVEAIRKMAKPEADDREKVKAYYVELTEVLRTYIENRYGFSAREMTSSEILDKLLDVVKRDGSDGALRELREIFETADLVKFARQTASMGETERSMAGAVDFVNTTRQAPHELPKPEVREVTLSERRQNLLRSAMLAGAVLLALAAAGLTGYLCVEVWETFL